jgi:site-specific DNA-methyltransferase (cytosine-N4-specific)
MPSSNRPPSLVSSPSALLRDVMTTTASITKDRYPVPPSILSLEDGYLKDTPANRALRPTTTSQETFTCPKLQKAAYFADRLSLIFHGEVRNVLRLLADEAVVVDCIVTSPPFYGQRDYGVAGQIGLEPDPRDFIDALVDVFELCRPILRETGSLWVNLGDTYWSGKGAHKSNEAKQRARRFGKRPQDHPGDGKWTRPKQLLLLPHRFAIAMQDAGWLVRNDNVWIKPNPIPDQVRDRCSMSHEHVFHFTKSRWYYFNRLAVGRKMPSGRVLPPLDTWVLPPSKGNGTHRASFSEELVRLPILATTPERGIVLDPFNGSGTSTLFARKQGLRAIGIDLNLEYCELAADRIKNIASTAPHKQV